MRVRKKRPRVKVRTVEWVRVECGGCGRDVLLLPGQRFNVCGWCQTIVVP